MIFGKNEIMQKIIIYILFISSTIGFSQTKDEITLPNGSKFLVGQITINDLKTDSYNNWFASNYSNYEVDTSQLQNVKQNLAQYNLLLFMGTWCGDSKREVPKIVKILNQLDFPMEQLKIVALDRRREFYKKSPGGEEWGLDIRKVPTLIFLKNGKEVNRIVENPIESLEKDISSILNGQQYIPNYSIGSK